MTSLRTVHISDTNICLSLFSNFLLCLSESHFALLQYPASLLLERWIPEHTILIFLRHFLLVLSLSLDHLRSKLRMCHHCFLEILPCYNLLPVYPDPPIRLSTWSLSFGPPSLLTLSDI